jgi:uncharacterized repeat protein (TIGR03943 family)
VNRQAQAVVLLLVGGAVLRASLTDMYLRYVKQGLRPFLIVAGVLLVAMAVMTLWYELRAERAAASGRESHDDGSHDDGSHDDGSHDDGSHDDGSHDDGSHDDGHDGHGHHREPRVAWLLVLPVFGLLLVAPPALGSYAASRNGTALSQPSDFPALPPGDPAKITVLDYASRAVFDKGQSIGTRRVQLTGFVVDGPSGQPYLARMVLTCCAADARPVKVGLAGQVPDGLRPDTWLEVVGTYSSRSDKDTVNGETIPYLDVADARPVAAPAEQYES